MEKKKRVAELADSMILSAMEKHDCIYPCSNKQDFAECFTHENDRLLFWYNTQDNSTHLLMAEV